MPAAQAADILGELSIDGAATLLRRLPDEAAARILDAAPQRVMTGALRMIIAYPEDTAGALLDPTVLALPSDVDARDALDRVLRDARYALYYVYAVDRQHRLVGVMSLRELMLAAPEKLLADIMHRDVERVRSTAGIGEIVAHPGWREHHALPVVEDSGTFLGVIRYGTLRRLEHAGTGLERRSPALDAAVSLSELYWHGVSALIDGVAAVAAISRAREAGARVEAQ
ncbi:MAG: hypothetical protein AUH85_04335 [Chloroflexi bacterium 13_1_40CM_4_68_4]|nr:MAG: hypothetical protein AUH85_04335 [Chloroflexi bacterium 13_1_40CM_4_68_4]